MVCMPVSSNGHTFTHLSQSQKKVVGKTFISVAMKIEQLNTIQTPQCVSLRKIPIIEFQRMVEGHSLSNKSVSE